MNPSLVTVWRKLRPHLEWANGFNLVFLFADHPAAVETLRSRLDDSLHLRTLRLRVLNPESPTALVGLADEILTPRAGFGPLWVELWRQAEDQAWQQARTTLLHSLNERRGKLENVVRQPLVLILPTAERNHVYIMAPDLWAIRSFTGQLDAPTTVALTHPDSILTRERESKPVSLLGPGPAEQEWNRLLLQTAERVGLNPWDGVAAFEAAMERGDLYAARRIATETLELTRTQLYPANGKQPSRGWWITGLLRKPRLPPPDPEHQRNLLVALANVGGVESDLGNLEPARAAYRESLELRRQLREAFPAIPQFQRDLEWFEGRWAEFIERHGDG